MNQNIFEKLIALGERLIEPAMNDFTPRFIPELFFYLCTVSPKDYGDEFQVILTKPVEDVWLMSVSDLGDMFSKDET